MKGWLALGAIAVAVLAVGAPSAAARTTTQNEPSVVISGGLTYAWHADPRRGCLAARVCGLSGAISVQGDGSSSLFYDVPRTVDLDLPGAVTVRVQRVGAGGAVTECVESLGQSDVSIDYSRRRAGPVPALVSSLPMSHCATPLIDDLARLRLTARYAASRPTSLDLRARVPFVSGPYTGTLTSTITTRPDSSGFGSSSSSESGPGSAPPTHRRRFEYVAMRYRATFLGGGSGISFSSGSTGVCVLLDSCGVTGSSNVSIPAASFTFRVTASRAVRQPMGGARVLADLAAGRLTLDEPLYATHQFRGAVTAQTTQDGTQNCEAERHGIPLSLGADGYGGALGFFVDDASGSEVALRAYCAGPTTADVLGNGRSSDLLTGSLPLKDLAPPQSATVLERRRDFRAIPYSGRWAGQAMLILRRTALRTGTRWERVG